MKTFVSVIEAREPHNELARYLLDAIPRPGDLILVQVRERQFVSYRIDFVNFDPFDSRSQVKLGVTIATPQPSLETGEPAPINLKDRMDMIVKAQLQLIEKGQAYSNVMIVAAYAGIFALWNFGKQSLTQRASNLSVLLVGFSLVLFITWEINSMLLRARTAARFLKEVDKEPSEFFNIQARNESASRKTAARLHIAWKIVVVPTIVAGYIGGAILFYNVAASIVGLPQWP